MFSRSFAGRVTGTVLAATVLTATVGLLTPASAMRPSGEPTANTATWNGKGTTLTDDVYTLNRNVCDDDSTPFLVFQLVATKSTTATLTIPGEDPVTMNKPRINIRGFSVFRYTYAPGEGFDLTDLVGATSASYNDSKNRGRLIVTKGCVPAHPAAECVQVNADPDYLDFNGGFKVGGSDPVYTDSGCTTNDGVGTNGFGFVYAPGDGWYTPQHLCDDAFGTGTTPTALLNDIYWCDGAVFD